MTEHESIVHIPIAEIGRAACRAAKHEWEQSVVDKDGHELIAHYHRATNNGGLLENGVYDESEDFWCGIFVAFCFVETGNYIEDFAGQCVPITLKQSLGPLFASTTKLTGRHKVTFEDKGVKPPQIIDPSEVQPGDIPVVKTGRTTRVWGDHITLARSGLKADDTIKTWEGNTTGPGPNGDKIEGVVRDEISMENVAVILRLRPEHFDVGDQFSVTESRIFR